MKNNGKVKALALISGGLDSLLAAKIIMEQGVQVEGINFVIGFAPGKTNSAQNVADQLGINLYVVDVVEEFKEIIRKPKHGYGAHLNPCLDCKIFMVEHALRWAKEHDFDFVVTGEVVGQRPMSQRTDTMPIVARESGADDLLLRPLSAKLLPETLAEREGWVDRNELYGINGRTRKPQIALAHKFGFKEFPSPAGGCLLTEDKYCDRLKDLWAYRMKKDYSREDIELLKIGRHLRPVKEFKIIVGRNAEENENLEQYVDKYISIKPLGFPGPTSLIDGVVDENTIIFAASITAYFSKMRYAEVVNMQLEYLNGETNIISIKPLMESEFDSHWFI